MSVVINKNHDSSYKTHLTSNHLPQDLQTLPQSNLLTKTTYKASLRIATIKDSMAPSTSSGKKPSRDILTKEQRGRMTWDPDFKKKFQDQISSSESDEDDSYENYDYPLGTYVSGGQKPAQHHETPTQTQPRIPTAATLDGAAGPAKTANENGFQRVPHRTPLKRRVPRRVNFGVNRDNEAKAAFRQRAKPDGKYLLPRNCNEITPDRVKMYDYLEELGVRLGSFIRPPQHVRDRELLIWGDPDQVARTKAELYNWVAPSPGSMASTFKSKDKFADIYSTQGDKFKRDERKIKRDAEVRKFQQEPAPGAVFATTGSFLWPFDSIAPTELLGAGLEAMDPVRIKFRCHITFDARLCVFKVLTNNIESVKDVHTRILGIMKEYVARIQRSNVKYYIEPAHPSAYRKHMATEPVSSFSFKSVSPVIPVMTGKHLEAKERDVWIRQQENLKDQSDRGIEEELRETLPNLRFYRGQVRMRVYFGTFALTSYKWRENANTIPFEEFMTNLAEPGTKGTLIRDLQFKVDTPSVMEKIYNATCLFQPIDNLTSSLADVAPSFSAYFECREGDKPPVKLEIEMTSNATNRDIYDISHIVWSKLGHGGNTTPIDMYMMNLVGGPSWKIQASTENTLDPSRITPGMHQFADSVNMRTTRSDVVEFTGESVFDYDKTGRAMLVRVFQQKTSLRFRLVRNTGYTIEISRYDTYDNPTDNLQSIKGKGPVRDSAIENSSQRTSWGATLWNTDWDSELIANTKLGIGESAYWNEKLSNFFPNPSGAPTQEGAVSEGVLEFLQIVSDVNNFLWDIKKGILSSDARVLGHVEKGSIDPITRERTKTNLFENLVRAQIDTGSDT